MTRWPFPYGLLLGLAVGVVLWIAIVALAPSAGAWALSLAMNIMGAK